MLLKGFLVSALTLGTAFGCSCESPSVETKLASDSVVFKGTITGFRETQLHTGEGDFPYRVAVFRVTRVWKGDVGETLEMSAFEEIAHCVGFWGPYLKVGTELLIYATGTDIFSTDVCGNHMLVNEATKDLAVLGPGREPRLPR